MDRIQLGDIRVLGYHGVYESERQQGQPFVATVTLGLDADRAGATDDLANTVDYAQLAVEVRDAVAGPACDLIEAVARRVAMVALAHELVQEVTVRITKPNADLSGVAQGAWVQIDRDRAWFAAQKPTDANVDAARTVGAEGFGKATPVAPQDGDENAASAVDAVTAASNAQVAPAAARALTQDVGIEEATTSEPVILALGGNQGDVRAQFMGAIEKLIDNPNIDVLDVSPLVRTAAQLEPGQEPQPDYLNCAVRVRTKLPLGQLLSLCQELEERAGRVMGQHWEPRPLDIDLIAAGDLQGATKRLTLPHPRAAERAFVLVPWAAIDPTATLPSGQSVSDLVAQLTESAIAGRWDDWLEKDPHVDLLDRPARAQVISPRTLDEAPAATKSAGTPAVEIPRRRRISELIEQANTHPAPSEETETPTLENLAARTTTQRRVTVRPTTTGTLPVMSADQLTGEQCDDQGDQR